MYSYLISGERPLSVVRSIEVSVSWRLEILYMYGKISRNHSVSVAWRFSVSWSVHYGGSTVHVLCPGCADICIRHKR